MSKGYVKVHRIYFDHWLWEKERERTRFEAWIDLLQRVSYEDRARFINRQLHDEKRGQLVASLRFLSQTWNWSTGRVDRFLKLLEERKIIKLEIKQGISLITICEYDTYHSNTAESETDSEPGQTIGESRQVQDTDTNDTNIRREKKEEELIKNIERLNTNKTEDPVENAIRTTLTYYQQNPEQKRCLLDACGFKEGVHGNFETEIRKFWVFNYEKDFLLRQPLKHLKRFQSWLLRAKEFNKPSAQHKKQQPSKLHRSGPYKLL